MKRTIAWIASLCTLLLVLGCGSSGKSATPPATIKAEARDSAVLVTFPMEAGVEYWLFYAQSPSLTSTNFTSVLGGRVMTGAASPQLVTGLVNGTTYYFTVNGRTGGGPGGPGTPLVSATPRVAGGQWTAGASIFSGDLRAVTYGGQFVAVGAGGAMFSSPDATTWTALNYVVTKDLYAVTYVNSVYVALGAGGTLLASSDAATWTQQDTGTTNDLYAVSGNGAGAYFVVGANGTIAATTPVNPTWTQVSSGTSNTLSGATYGNGRFVAVGARGVIVTSTDIFTWAPVASPVSSDLKSVAYNPILGLFVAVGAAGSVATSPDGTTWTRQNPITESTLNSVVAGSQFVAVASNASIYTSADGVTWSRATSPGTNALSGVSYGTGYYAAVGASGTNLTSF